MDESAAGAVLVHLCRSADVDLMERCGEHCPPSLADVGFVHLSTPAQVHLPADRLFSACTDTVLLWCDPALLAAPVRWERGVPTDPESMMFPHLYGPLPLAAVTGVTEYRPGADGTYPRLGQRG